MNPKMVQFVREIRTGQRANEDEVIERMMDYELTGFNNAEIKRTVHKGNNKALFNDVAAATNYLQRVTNSIGDSISCFTILLLLFSCVSYACFWTASARLMTDPNYLVFQPNYNRSVSLHPTKVTSLLLNPQIPLKNHLVPTMPLLIACFKKPFNSVFYTVLVMVGLIGFILVSGAIVFVGWLCAYK